MTAAELKRISKSMSYVLRHRPDTIGIQLEPAGWIEVEELLAAFARHGKSFSLDTIKHVVTGNDVWLTESVAQRYLKIVGGALAP
ncbi:MAG: RNA 2'-phosphotransferase [Planctomycetes bacterium]|nr:RNA 2'-phosphotransferase [Planctomycetota bacterium]